MREPAARAQMLEADGILVLGSLLRSDNALLAAQGMGLLQAMVEDAGNCHKRPLPAAAVRVLTTCYPSHDHAVTQASRR